MGVTPMRDVAVVAFAELHVARERERNDVEMVMPVVREALERAGLHRREIGVTVSGSSDYLSGIPFSFVMALDGIGAWPPIVESHVEMDGAFALHEAWVRLQHGDIDTALVYAFGKSSTGDLLDTLVMQLDPYYQAPLWPDPISLAALQARALLDGGRYGERDLAAVAARHRDVREVDALLAEPYLVAPLRRHDCAQISDGAAAIVLAVGERARGLCKRPAWIAGIDHRIEPHSLGARPLAHSPSTKLAGERAGVAAQRQRIDLAELHAPFSHQELILRDALELPPGVAINPTGGALAANPVMVAGLCRIGTAAQAILDGKAACAVAHATSGPCLQQNLVCLLEERA